MSTRVRSSLSSLLLCLSLTLGAIPVAQADPAGVDANRAELAEIEAGERSADDGVAQVRTLTTTSEAVLSPMQAEMKQVLQHESETLARLQAELKVAPGAVKAHELHESIAELKQATELSLLRIQLRYAEAAKDEALSQQLRASVEALENPNHRGEPQPRDLRAAEGR